LSTTTLVLGIGNTLLTDEGVGVHMLGYLQRHFPDLPGVDYLDGGTLSFTLAPRIENVNNLVVVDAAELGRAPGSVEVFTGTAMDRFAGRTKRSVHEVSLGDLLAIAHLTGHLPRNRALVAIQPHTVDWGPAPSATVSAALPEAAERVVACVRAWADPEQPALGTDTDTILQPGVEIHG
jgi:hydrogenase maturation protease